MGLGSMYSCKHETFIIFLTLKFALCIAVRTYVRYSGRFVYGRLKLVSNHFNVAKEHRNEKFVFKGKRSQGDPSLDTVILWIFLFCFHLRDGKI